MYNVVFFSPKTLFGMSKAIYFWVMVGSLHLMQ